MLRPYECVGQEFVPVFCGRGWVRVQKVRLASGDDARSQQGPAGVGADVATKSCHWPERFARVRRRRYGCAESKFARSVSRCPRVWRCQGAHAPQQPAQGQRKSKTVAR
jgi:hypothetical protein